MASEMRVGQDVHSVHGNERRGVPEKGDTTAISSIFFTFGVHERPVLRWVVFVSEMKKSAKERQGGKIKGGEAQAFVVYSFHRRTSGITAATGDQTSMISASFAFRESSISFTYSSRIF